MAAERRGSGCRMFTRGCLLEMRMTSATSMPPIRQILASSLENAMLIARKVFSTTLVISAVRMSVTLISPWQKVA